MFRPVYYSLYFMLINFIFNFRGFKTVGPFVVMIYRMVMGDLLRFVAIYLVFVMGFSQGYFFLYYSFSDA